MIKTGGNTETEEMTKARIAKEQEEKKNKNKKKEQDVEDFEGEWWGSLNILH